jgi:4-hydroxy-tetrahydrodipicolinate reductase
MKRIILSGANGRMGQAVTKMVSKREDCKIVAGIDKEENLSGEFPIFNLPQKDFLDKIKIEADVLIDFSHTSLLSKILNLGLYNKLPLVICTTGISEEQNKEIREVSNKIPIFYSENMSLCVNLMIALCKKTAAILGKDFDIEIVEKHHNQKLDSPSGTAFVIADAISNVIGDNTIYTFGRHSYNTVRDKREIGIHAIRGGTIVGEHEVIFAGHDEVFKITHTAESKDIFAEGAINAAMFLCEVSPGFYSMIDII